MRGQGTVYLRADGRWAATLSKGVVDGKRIREWIYSDTREGALRELARATFESGRGYPDADKLTVAEYLARWLEDVVARTTRARTQETYRYTVDKYIVPAIGSVLLSDLRPTSMDGFQTTLRRSGVPEPTVYYASLVLKGAIRTAAAKEVMPRNVFADVKLSKPKAAKFTPWTAEEAVTFLKTSEGHPLHALFSLALWCGLRHGELLALRWSDFTGNTVTVRHTLQAIRSGGKTRFDPNHPVKSESGERTLAVPPAALAAVTALRAAKLAAGKVDEFLFTTRTGAHYTQVAVTEAFKRLIRKAGVPVIRVHDLRHTCATLARAAGQDLDEICAQLGHSDIAVTQIYAHIPKAAAGFAMAMETALGQGGGK